MNHYREQQLIRTVMALCALAAQSVALDVRDDMRDEAYLLVHTWLRNATPSSSDEAELRQHCERLVSRLEIVATDTLQPRDFVLGAYAAVLRLHSALGPISDVSVKRAVKIVEQEKKDIRPAASLIPQTKGPGANHAKVLETVRQYPDIRTKELIGKLAGIVAERTIKRCLKELLAAGAIERSDNSQRGMVMYRAHLDPQE